MCVAEHGVPSPREDAHERTILDHGDILDYRGPGSHGRDFQKKTIKIQKGKKHKRLKLGAHSAPKDPRIEAPRIENRSRDSQNRGCQAPRIEAETPRIEAPEAPRTRNFKKNLLKFARSRHARGTLEARSRSFVSRNFKEFQGTSRANFKARFSRKRHFGKKQ